MSPKALCRRRLDFFRGFFAGILGGYFFCFFPEARQALLELVLNDAYRQVSESFCELDPEWLERRDHEDCYAD